jgi:hypothetical protein
LFERYILFRSVYFRINSAKPLCKKAIPTWKPQKEVHVERCNHITHAVSYVIGARIQLLIIEILDPIIHMTLASSPNRDRIFKALGDGIEDSLNILSTDTSC